jgi:hypothetical protein
MNHPATCPACGATFHYRETSGTRIFFACSSYTYEGRDALAYRTDECHYRQTIREAAVVIRAFLDGDRDAREKGHEWIAENTP